jgi:phage repressor protein C with HTH and peptisase S24 domain
VSDGVSANRESTTSASVPARSNVIPFRRVSKEERTAGVLAAPLVDLRFAAGTFSPSQNFEEGATDWVALPDWVRPQPGLFVAQVIGESMNRRIPNGSWCLFRANPGGTREGKVVVVQHRSIFDVDTGGRYTVKLYKSEKVPAQDGGWEHKRITLHPDSDRAEFNPIEIDLGEDDGSFLVIAEMLTVLPISA